MIKLCIISTIPNAIKVFFGKQLDFLTKNSFDITIITSSALSSQDYGGNLPACVKLYTLKISRTINLVEDYRALREISKIIKQGNFDIVQYVTPKAALLGSLASWHAKVPVRLYLMWGLYYVTQTGLKRFIFKMIEKLVCSCSTAIAPDSIGNVKFAIQEGLCKPEKIGVVGHGSANGVDTERFDPDKLAEAGKAIRADLHLPDDAIVLGCIAPIVGDKGINELVEAFNIVSKKYSKVYLLYIGQTTEKDPVKSSTLEILHNHSQIIHLGWQSEPEKYMAAMDVFVLPTYREGFGVVNIEASAMQLPVITTDVPGPQEAVVNSETGILVPAREVQPLVEAMIKLLNEPAYAKILGTAGRKRVQEYYEQKKLWKAILDHRLHLLNAVIKKK